MLVTKQNPKIYVTRGFCYSEVFKKWHDSLWTIDHYFIKIQLLIWNWAAYWRHSFKQPCELHIVQTSRKFVKKNQNSHQKKTVYAKTCWLCWPCLTALLYSKNGYRSFISVVNTMNIFFAFTQNTLASDCAFECKQMSGSFIAIPSDASVNAKGNNPLGVVALQCAVASYSCLMSWTILLRLHGRLLLLRQSSPPSVHLPSDCGWFWGRVYDGAGPQLWHTRRHGKRRKLKEVILLERKNVPKRKNALFERKIVRKNGSMKILFICRYMLCFPIEFVLNIECTVCTISFHFLLYILYLKVQVQENANIVSVRKTCVHVFIILDPIILFAFSYA